MKRRAERYALSNVPATILYLFESISFANCLASASVEKVLVCLANGSILPPLLALFEGPTPMFWRISRGLMAIMLGCWALTFPSRRWATNPAPLPIFVIIFVAAMGLIALALAANAIAMPVARLPAVYAASITAILVDAASWFLFAWAHWYDALQ